MVWSSKNYLKLQFTFQYCLRSKTTLLAYTIPMNFLGLGDAENDIALTLPDEMQPSTIINIKPPSHHNLKADHVSKVNVYIVAWDMHYRP